MKKVLMLVFCAATTGCVTVPGVPAKDGKQFLAQANISGTIKTNAMMRQKPLSERGYKNIGVITDETTKIGVTNVALTIFGNTFDEYDFSKCLDPDRISKLFVENINSVRGYEASELPVAYSEFSDVAQWNTWHGTYSLDFDDVQAREFSESLRDGHDVDALLLITETPSYDFVGGTSVELQPKGLYTRMKEHEFAYSSFEVRMIDLVTGEEIPASYYRQGSFWEMQPINWELSWQEQPASVVEELCSKIKSLDSNNVDRALWMLRVNTSKEPVPSALSKE